MMTQKPIDDKTCEAVVSSLNSRQVRHRRCVGCGCRNLSIVLTATLQRGHSGRQTNSDESLSDASESREQATATRRQGIRALRSSRWERVAK